MDRKAEDPPGKCGLPCALEMMGERWSFMILGVAFRGVRHFEDFLLELGIARNILSNRLTRLVENGIMERKVCCDDRRRVEYHLTEKGKDLLPAMIALRQWGEKYRLGVPSTPMLVDRRDRRPVGPVCLESHDGRLLCSDDVEWAGAD